MSEVSWTAESTDQMSQLLEISTVTIVENHEGAVIVDDDHTVDGTQDQSSNDEVSQCVDLRK